MGQIKTATAEIDISYLVDCPYCGETHFSEHEEAWDTDEMIYYDVELHCDGCGKAFMIKVPSNY